MNRLRASASAVAIAIGSAGCSWLESFDPYSPSQLHRTVQPISEEPGLYIVNAKIAQVREFGENMEIAVPKYLAAYGLVPTECANEVTFVSRAYLEGGAKMWAKFRCTGSQRSPQ